MTQEIERLVEYHKANCNRYVNGFCTTRKCFLRGGYSGSGPVGDVQATCEEHETVAVLQSDALTAPIKREEELRDALQKAESYCYGLEVKAGETRPKIISHLFDAALNPNTESVSDEPRTGTVAGRRDAV